MPFQNSQPKIAVFVPKISFKNLCKMAKGDVRTKFVHLEKYLRSRANHCLFVFQIIFLRFICVGVCAGSSYWLYIDFIGRRISPDGRDLTGGFNCELPDEYRWTDKNAICDGSGVNATCKGRVILERPHLFFWTVYIQPCGTSYLRFKYRSRF